MGYISPKLRDEVFKELIMRLTARGEGNEWSLALLFNWATLSLIVAAVVQSVGLYRAHWGAFELALFFLAETAVFSFWYTVRAVAIAREDTIPIGVGTNLLMCVGMMGAFTVGAMGLLHFHEAVKVIAPWVGVMFLAHGVPVAIGLRDLSALDDRDALRYAVVAIMYTQWNFVPVVYCLLVATQGLESFKVLVALVGIKFLVEAVLRTRIDFD